MHSYDDKYYIDRILHGDVKAFSHLVETHKRMAYTLAHKLVQVPEDAEEIAQDAFVKAYQSLADFKGECKFSTWLYKIVYHTAISRLRKKNHEIISIDDDHYSNFDVCDTENFLTKLSVEEQNVLVRKAVDRLPAEERAVIILYYLNESSVKEITLITGDSESNVKIRLFRARKKLWEMLKSSLKDQFIAI
jgi:RNA polymerase sigma factor (sigma-70 family)